MKIINWLKSFFTKNASIFRDGLENFLVENLQLALEVGLETLKNGNFLSTHDFVETLWGNLRSRFPNTTSGIWLKLLANLIADAMKKSGNLKI